MTDHSPLSHGEKYAALRWRGPEDAPSWYNAEEASAWACGWEACKEFLRLTVVCAFCGLDESECVGGEDGEYGHGFVPLLVGNAEPPTSGRSAC